MAEAVKIDWDKADRDIEYTGSRITLPADPAKMPIPKAIEALQRKQKDEEEIISVVEFVDAHPMDGAVAFMKAVQRKFGWASPVPTPGFFGPKPPKMVGVKTGPGLNDTIQVLWGDFLIPGVSKPITTAAYPPHEGKPATFVVHGEVKRMEAHIVKELADLTRQIVKAESIYKGKAIRLRVNEDGDLIHSSAPDFIATDHIAQGDLVLNDGEGDQVEVSLWTPIRHTAACVANKIPLKRGVLLAGPYGTGKSLTATVTSQVCVENKWTFIYLDDVKALKDALLFAKRYEPAVVFAEDIDRAAENRDQRGNDLLNVIDGILSKDSQIITVLTTNFPEKLDRAMLRPGRLDAVVSFKAPDASSVQKLVKIYARELLPDGEDLSGVGHELAGNIPATIREVVERSKLAMIGRGARTISASDLLVAARGMKAHLALLEEPKPSETVEQALARSLRAVTGLNGEAKVIGVIHKKVEEIHNATC